MMSRETTARHESGHAAAGAVLGLLPLRLMVADDGRAGRCWFAPWEIDQDSARDNMLITLAGPLAEGKDAPSWPLDRTESGDAKDLEILARYLKLEESDYEQLVAETHRLLARRDVGLLMAGFVALLEECSDVDCDPILDVAGYVLGAEGLSRCLPNDKKEYAHAA